MKQNVKIILASGSPRRRELLTQAGLEFTVLVTDADESIDITDPAEVVHILSQRKADAAADEFLKRREDGEEVLIVSADTVVALEGKVIGKPKDEKDALDILMSLSGKTHDVYTGVSCILISGDKRENVISFVERTGVTMYAFDEAEALDYISTKEPMDKAGAYGIQGIGARLVEKIDGDYNNVVGFPLAAFLRRCYNRFTRFE
jgi:MAF protein